MKVRFEKSTIQLATFLMFLQVQTQFSLSQKNSLVEETHLTVATLWRNGIPKMTHPIVNAYMNQVTE